MATPVHRLAPLAGAALAFLGKEIAPSLLDIMITALDRRLAQPKSTAVTLLSATPKVFIPEGRGLHQQARHRGGRFGARTQKGRRLKRYPEQETADLKAQADYLKTQLDAIQKRIEELTTN
jgi:hypothetical protein